MCGVASVTRQRCLECRTNHRVDTARWVVGRQDFQSHQLRCELGGVGHLHARQDRGVTQLAPVTQDGDGLCQIQRMWSGAPRTRDNTARNTLEAGNR